MIFLFAFSISSVSSLGLAPFAVVFEAKVLLMLPATLCTVSASYSLVTGRLTGMTLLT